MKHSEKDAAGEEESEILDTVIIDNSQMLPM